MLGRKRVRDIEHAEVIGAVQGIIRTDGLLAVTSERIAAALEVPRVAVDVDTVLAEAYRDLWTTEIAEVRRTVLANPVPAEQLRALLAWLATPPEDSDAVRLEAWALTRRNPLLRTAVRDNEAAWHAFVASVVRRGARVGDFLEADADEVAAQVISLIDGINAYQLIGYRSDLDRMRLLTRLLRSELGVVWGPALADAFPPDRPA